MLFRSVDDTERWQALTKALSDDGYRSFISQENMIDHIFISNELKINYLANSVGVGLPFTFLKNYSTTTSDHIPVLARFQFFAPPTATESVSKLQGNVYPNPTSGDIELSLDENLSKQVLQVTLSDPRGYLIFEGNGNLETLKPLINQALSKRSAGIYLLKVVDNQQRAKVFKVVKE